MAEKTDKKPEIPYREFSDPARSRLKDEQGNSLARTAHVYEPHDYNRKLLESQRARRVPANIPQIPTLGKTHKIAIKPPKQLDLVAKAKAIHAAAEAARAALEQGGEDVLPDDGIQFEELES